MNKKEKFFLMAIRQALLAMVDAIERYGKSEDWYDGIRTSELRKDLCR